MTTALFKPIKIGDIDLKNRIFMAPLTRSRSKKEGHVQTSLHRIYYEQRASAGLIISEATQISAQGQGYAWTPGIYTEEQVAKWREITDAVHQAGGRIFNQLWHVGAISHAVFQPNQRTPVSSSPWTPEGAAYVGDYHVDGPVLPHVEAHALTQEEMKEVLKDYQHAAKMSEKAGFDGVELHAANGYLIDQFLRDSVNQRTDQYGGSIENRVRFLIDVLEALLEVMPASRIGVRLTPIGGAGGSFDSDPLALYTAAAKALAGRDLAYLHVVRPNSFGNDQKEVGTADKIMASMRDVFDGVMIVNGQFSPEEAERWVVSGKADAVAFGRMFIANPDLPARIKNGGPYNDVDESRFVGGGAEGFTDYPTLEENL